MTVLVVVAHPDDETLGAGATIARLADEGESVHIAIVGGGYGTRQRIEETERAADHLGALTSQWFEAPDQRFDTVPALELIQKLESVIAELEPSTVYTHHPGDLNLDHVLTYRIVMTACRPVNNNPVRTIYAMEIPSSTEWAQIHSFQPAVYVDVVKTIDRKIEAMEMYETERREWPHPRSPAALRALARTRGAAAGLKAAEAFQVIRHIRG